MSKITLEQYAMGRDLLYPTDWEIVKINAEILLKHVNEVLEIFFAGKDFFVSSGWRPQHINENVPNAAKSSLHIFGKAIDIMDHDGFLKQNFDPRVHPVVADYLREYSLFMESPEHTPTWCHLDMGFRADRPTRIFIP